MSRVVVIGGGVIGLCAGISLRSRGVDVKVYDDPFGAPGASAWNCGWLAPSHCHPLPSSEALRRSTRWLLSREAAPLSIRPEPRLARWLLGFAWSARSAAHARGFHALVELMGEALPAWRRLERDGLAIAWTTDGALIPFLDRARLESEAHDLQPLVALGLADPATLDLDAARERIPSLSSSVVGAIELKGEPGLDPAATLEALRARFEEAGGRRVAEPVIDLTRQAGRSMAVVTRSGPDTADRVVLAAGVWSSPLAHRLGARLPVTSGRGYAIDLEPAPGHPERVVQLIEASMAIAPLGDRLRVCGTMELARPTAAIDRGRVQLMLRSPARYFDGWEAPTDPPRVMTAPRPMTPDGLPVIGPLKGSPDVIVATGHGMLGMTLGAVTGEIVAELVTDGRSDVPAAFLPSRFRW